MLLSIFIILSKDIDLNKRLISLLTFLMCSFSTLASAPLGAPPQFNNAAQKTETLKDGQSIILGKFKSRKDADFQLSSLLDFMDNNSKLVNLELINGFDYAVKESGELYVVSIEPFVDDKVLIEVFEIVNARYPKAYIEECHGCVKEDFLKARVHATEEQEQELLENAIALEEDTHVAITVEEDGAGDAKEEKSAMATEKPAVETAADLSAGLPFKTEYIFYGVGAIALIVLIFLLIRKPKKASEEELRELHAQAQELEAEMSQYAEEEHVAEEPEIVTEPAAPAAPEAVEAVAVQEKLPVTEVEAPVAKADAGPRDISAINHKLREPNSTIGNITKDNFKEFEGLRLLIAEDNLINQKVIVGLLKESGINIKIANDGQECLEILEEDPNYPIILMDAHMPRVDGLEATRLIRQNPAYDHITVMALSGDTGADDIRKMRDAGMEEQLEKPLKVAALYQALYCYFDPDAVTSGESETSDIHLDEALAIEMLGGDVELYNEILNEFQTLYHDSDEKIELWLKHGDFDRAKALLLDVKGIGESIGTAQLTQTAEEFREAIIAGESDKFPKLMNLYRSQLHSILADIAEV